MTAVESADDLIMTRRNVHRRAVANRQIYEIFAVHPDGSATVRLHDTRTVKDLPSAYLAQPCHLACGVTSHAAQGATFAGNGYAVVLPTTGAIYIRPCPTGPVGTTCSRSPTSPRRPAVRVNSLPAAIAAGSEFGRQARGCFCLKGVIKPFRHLVRIKQVSHHAWIGDRSATARKDLHAP